MAVSSGAHSTHAIKTKTKDARIRLAKIGIFFNDVMLLCGRIYLDFEIENTLSFMRLIYRRKGSCVHSVRPAPLFRVAPFVQSKHVMHPAGVAWHQHLRVCEMLDVLSTGKPEASLRP